MQDQARGGSPRVLCYGHPWGRDTTTSDVIPQPVQESATNSETSVKVRRVEVADAGTVLLRTTAVRVINRSNGRSTLAYQQHDTASQVTLISEALKDELGLQAVPDQLRWPNGIERLSLEL